MTAAFSTKPARLTANEREEMQTDLAELMDILSWQRPHGSKEEEQFVSLFVDDLADHPNVSALEIDGFGNRWITVPGRGQSNRLLFSCHTDSVAARGGRQEIKWSEDEDDTLQLKKPKPGRCLGADDGAGLWLLRRMIDAGTAGTYVFHRGEEKGRLGSCYVEEHEPQRLEGYEACIAFDRRDTRDLITHQMGERCASEAFSTSLADALFYASDGDLRYAADPTGSYTDSYTYRSIIPECTNLSVGYDREHGPRETLDAAHVWRLSKALPIVEWSTIKIDRDPTSVEWDWSDYGRPYTYGHGQSTASTTSPRSRAYLDEDFWNDSEEAPFGSNLDTMERLCRNFPEAAASLLHQLGIDPADFTEALTATEAESAARFIIK